MISDEGILRAAHVMSQAVDRYVLRDFSFDLERLDNIITQFADAVDRLVELQNPDDGK